MQKCVTYVSGIICYLCVGKVILGSLPLSPYDFLFEAFRHTLNGIGGAMYKISKTVTALIVSLATISSFADQTKPELKALFETLKNSEDLIEISEVQNEIWFHWYELPSDASALQTIFDDGMRALHFGQPQIAVDHFTRVIESAPDFAEASNRRATTFFMLGDF